MRWWIKSASNISSTHTYLEVLHNLLVLTKGFSLCLVSWPNSNTLRAEFVKRNLWNTTSHQNIRMILFDFLWCNSIIRLSLFAWCNGHIPSFTSLALGHAYACLSDYEATLNYIVSLRGMNPQRDAQPTKNMCRLIWMYCTQTNGISTIQHISSETKIVIP